MAVLKQRKPLPTLPEMFIGRATAGDIMAGVNDRLATMAKYVGLARFNAILRPYSQTWRPDMTKVAAAQTRRFTFNATKSGWLLVMLGYQSANVATGLVTAKTREIPAVDVNDHIVPGSGAVIDPGCQWSTAGGDLPTVIQGRSFTEWGLGWTDNSYTPAEPPEPGDPVAPKPRLLYVDPDHLTFEIEITWQDVFLNTLTVVELFDSGN